MSAPPPGAGREEEAPLLEALIGVAARRELNLLAALTFDPDIAPEPIGRVRRRWWRLGWLSALAVARDRVSALTPPPGAGPSPDLRALVEATLPEQDAGDLAGGTFYWGERAGWNAAREAMLAALTPPASEPE